MSIHAVKARNNYTLKIVCNFKEIVVLCVRREELYKRIVEERINEYWIFTIFSQGRMMKTS